MFYLTRTRTTDFDLVGPFRTVAEAQRWSAEARNAEDASCTTAVFEADSEPVFCTIVDPATGEPRLAGGLPDSVAIAIEGERHI